MGHVYPDSDLDPVDIVEFWAALARERAVVEGVEEETDDAR
jgi:hypothetical protein